MADAPKQVRLDLTQFPDAPWAKALVGAFNQLSQQVTQAGGATQPTFRELRLKTGPTPSKSFPIDVKVDAPVKSVSVALVVSGTPSGAVFATASMLSGGKLLRVSNISGLAANTEYTIRLALE